MTWAWTGRATTGGVLLLLGLAAPPLRAQDPRQGAVSRAFNEFDSSRRLDLLAPALDPSLGPLEGWWPVGVQLMAQTLLEEHRDSLAATYLRWALRQAPGFQADTVQFLPEVVAAVGDARQFVGQTARASDSLASTSWRWPAEGSTDTTGQLQVTAPTATGLRAYATGVGAIPLGSPTILPPGSYRLSAAGAGYDSLEVTREILPGATTMVELRPRRAPIAASPPPAARIPAANTAVESQPRKKFPWVIVAGGAAAAGIAVVALSGGGKESPPPPPTTGSISFTFPNP